MPDVYLTLADHVHQIVELHVHQFHRIRRQCRLEDHSLYNHHFQLHAPKF